MLRRIFPLLLVFTVVAAAAEPAAWDRVVLPPMKTSIHVGRVTLITGEFERNGAAWSSTYEAKVRPWFFWSESGTITIRVAEADLERLARGETVEFTGDALNHRNKPRKVTGRAQPESAAAGRIKVRIHVDDIELIFNGPYQFR